MGFELFPRGEQTVLGCSSGLGSVVPEGLRRVKVANQQRKPMSHIGLWCHKLNINIRK